MEWVEVVSDGVKIGLGAVISGVTSYLILRQTHAHEIELLKSQHQKELIGNRTDQAIKFVSLAHSLTYQHVLTTSSFESSEYLDFLQLYNAVMLTASIEFKITASQLFDKVNTYIGLNKEFTSNARDNAVLKARQDVNNALGDFHKQASIELKST